MNRYSNYLLASLLLIMVSNQLFAHSTQNIFTHIYNTHAWRVEYSGPGSTLKETVAIRKRIPGLLQELNAKVLLDAPCGDFNWIQHVDLNFLDQYIGMDIVEVLIEKNKQEYENGNRLFLHANIITDNLPQADVILCRDCLVHLKFQDIMQALKNMKSSGITYLLATTHTTIRSNCNLKKTGGWRRLNLQRPPFNFPKPIELIKEGCTYKPLFSDKSLGLWKIEDII